jgi:hypothetical protein
MQRLQSHIATLTALGMLLFLLSSSVNGDSPAQATPLDASVIDEVARYATDLQPDDRLVEFEGVVAKASNVHGVHVNGTRYYYRVLHHVSFDPASRGAAAAFETVGTIHPETEWEVRIYREAQR